VEHENDTVKVSEMDVLVSSDVLSLRYTVPISLPLMMMTLSAAEYRIVLVVITLALLNGAMSIAQDNGTLNPESTENCQLKVNWLYRSYVPKEVPLTPLRGKKRWTLYVRSTYTT